MRHKALKKYSFDCSFKLKTPLHCYYGIVLREQKPTYNSCTEG